VLPDDFHDARIAKVWEVATGLLNNNITLTIETMARALREAGAHDAVGGVRFLHELIARAAASVWAEQWMEDLLRAAAVRRIQRAALHTLMASAFGSYEDVVKEASSMEKVIAERATVEDAVSMREGMTELTNLLMEGLSLETSGRTTGFKGLDDLLGGYSDGQMITLAARPGMGKTSLAIGMLLAAAKDIAARKEDGVCLLVTIEMPRVEIVRRATSQLSGLTEAELKRKPPRETMSRVVAAGNELAQLPIYIHDSTYWLHDLKALLYRMRLKHKRLRLVVIDYLQLMRAKLDRKESNREQEVAEVSRSIKSFAKEFKCPFLALSQLNRGCETRPGKNKRPMLADLRESGSLEQDSDVVMFIYRDEVYNKDTEDKGIAEVIVAKQRSGPTDTVRLRFARHITRFMDLQSEMFDGNSFKEVPPEEPTHDGIETAWEDES
jgi:replicative DNA helicase